MTFSHLKQNAAACPTSFDITYICEQSFTLTNLNKSKVRNIIKVVLVLSIGVLTSGFNHPGRYQF